MKIISPALVLSFLCSTLPILVTAQCEACDALDKMEACTQTWSDQFTLCYNSACDHKPSSSLLDNCMGGVTDESPITGGAVTSTTKGALTTSTSNRTTISPTATSPGRKITASAAAAPAKFGGIGFGGGAAAMVCLAGLVGLVL